jgi:hypothetical protein
VLEGGVEIRMVRRSRALADKLLNWKTGVLKYYAAPPEDSMLKKLYQSKIGRKKKVLVSIIFQR